MIRFNTYKINPGKMRLLTMEVTRKPRKNNRIGRMTTYSMTTPVREGDGTVTLFPTMTWKRLPSSMVNAGPEFEMRFKWFRWSFRLLAREVRYWFPEENARHSTE